MPASIEVRVARFDQVLDVSDADRALAFANIEKAANYYNVNLAETSWHDLGVHPQKKKMSCRQGAVTRTPSAELRIGTPSNPRPILAHLTFCW
jgi:arginyl-tRNA synthetase